jgi:hypothetical protein
VFLWDDGSRYEGQWLHDSIMGMGCWRCDDGRSYEGEWSCNKFHGKGKLCDNGIIYEGNFVNGQRHGRGLVTFSCDYASSHEKDSHDGHSFNAGDKMDCCFMLDKRHGFCKYTFFNGETFSCTWVDGRCPEFSARQRVVVASADPKRASVVNALQKMHFEVPFQLKSCDNRHICFHHVIKRSVLIVLALFQSCKAPLTSPQHLLPAFEKEGVTDDVVRSLALVDLKALGLSTMAEAVQFKSCVSELLLARDGQVIEKPTVPAVSGAADALPSAPPLELLASTHQPRSQQRCHDASNVPPEFTDQLAPRHSLHSAAIF